MTADEVISPSTARHLLLEVARTQREGRLPSLVAGVTRGGRLVWSGSRGSGDPGEDTQYRIGSITKTMTAILVLRLRDEGRLALDDPIEKHVPGLPFGDRTVGQLLAHESGLRAEPPGETGQWWERVPGIDWAEFASRLRRDDVREPAGRRFHYSNPGYVVLGELVARLRGRPWWDVLREEVLLPLGMERTTYHPRPDAAPGWAVHPWADLVMPEPAVDLGAGAAAGQLWSTVADLGRFAGLLLGATDQKVIAASTLAEMALPTGVDVGGGRRGYGLGMFNLERPGGDLIGHGGSVPGYVAGLFVNREQQTGVAVLTNGTSGGNTNLMAMRLLDVMREREPYLGPTWRPLDHPDDAALALTGVWYWGTNGVGLRLTAEGDLTFNGLEYGSRNGLFRRDAAGEWTGREGYHTGETLRPVHDAEGRVVALDVGTFVFTREPYDPSAPTPGGRDPQGWRPMEP